ncbi:MAG: IclR family transcriptional regulator C-terminal domain-containing protein [Jannaschia sp.]
MERRNSQDEGPTETRPAKAVASAGLMTAGPDRIEEQDSTGMNPRDYVSSLARGLEVLRAFNRTGRKMTLSQVASETGNTRAGARRILLTLVHEGYAVADGKLFDLTPLVLELGHSVLSSKGVWEIAKPFIDHLSEEVHESVSAAVLDNYDVVYVSGSQYHRIISVGISVGSRFPAHCTANGRVLLAAQPKERWEAMLRDIDLVRMTDRTVTDRKAFRKVLEKTRDQGWSMVDQELEIGLMSISAPLRTSAGALVGAINVGVPTLRMSPEEMVAEILPKLQTTVSNISKALKG